MKALFNIPIYALTESELNQRVEEYETSFRMRTGGKLDYSFFKMWPQRHWRYNHIVGYIFIYKDCDELFVELFLPVVKIEKYYWKSKKKKFMENQDLNDMHLYLPLYKSNADVVEDLDSIILEIKKRYLPRMYYVDKDAYDNIKSMVDYISM